MATPPLNFDDLGADPDTNIGNESSIVTLEPFNLPPETEIIVPATQLPDISPESSASLSPNVDELGIVNDKENKISSNLVRHQGTKGYGGLNENDRVLFCTNLNTDIDYESLYEDLKHYGNIERIRLILNKVSKAFDAYISFRKSSDALLALQEMETNSKVKCKLMNIKNVTNGNFDFIPSKVGLAEDETKQREIPPATWYVAEVKEGFENKFEAKRCLERKVGAVTPQNLKKYGRNLLIQAGDETQAMMLSEFRPHPQGNIKRVTPHKTFNVVRGIIFDRDLYKYTETEILDICPETIYKVQKMRNSNDAIILYFSCPLPYDIRIEHIRIKVKKYKIRPRQCYLCYEYGHISKYCISKPKCKVCSGEDHRDVTCNEEEFCFHCNGNHSPAFRRCPRYRFEEEIIETAYNEHVSIGSAKRIVMAANPSESSTYASVLKNIKKKEILKQASKKARNRNFMPQHDTPANSTLNITLAEEECAHDESLGSPVKNVNSVEEELDIDQQNFSSSLPCLAIDIVASSTKKDTSSSSTENKTTKDNYALDDKPLEAQIKKEQQVKEKKQEQEKKSRPSTNHSSSLEKMDTDPTNNDGFIEPSSRKRSHSTSPKKDGISTFNSFAVLEETHSTKKQALVRNRIAHENSNGARSRNSHLAPLSRRNHNTTTASSTREQRASPSSREHRASPSSREQRTSPTTQEQKTSLSTKEQRVAPSPKEERIASSTKEQRVMLSRERNRSQQNPHMGSSGKSN